MDMRVLKGYRVLQSLDDGSLHIDTGTQCIPIMPACDSNASSLEVIELTTAVGTHDAFTTEEQTLLNEAWNKGKPVIIKCPLDLGTMKLPFFAGVAMWGLCVGDMPAAVFAFSFGSYVVQLVSLTTDGEPNGTWMQSASNV